MLAKRIAHLGWSAETVDEAGRLLARIRDPDRERIDVVLVDSRLFVGSDRAWTQGWEALASQGTRPTLILTHALGATPPQALPGSVVWDGTLAKPITPSDLVDLVESLHSGPPASHRMPGPRRLEGLRILVVEDHPVNRFVAQELLEKEGAWVALVPGGHAALAELAERSFDCILMDLQMPEMDGFEATRRIRAQHGDQPFIVAVTANATPGDREACLEAGMDSHVGKPLHLETLVDTIRSGKVRRTDGPVDWATALARMDHDTSFFRRVVEGVVSSADALFARWNAGWPTGPVEDQVREVHTLKGFAATVGATGLADEAARIEAALQTGHVASVSTLTPLWQAARQELSAFLASQKKPQSFPSKEACDEPGTR